MSLSASIKSIQDIMRKDVGVDGDAQRLSQLAWMLFLKIFDAQETELEMTRDDYRSPFPQKLRWRNWAADAEGITGDTLMKFINDDLFPGLKELKGTAPRHQLIRATFEDAYNYMKSGTLLRQVVNKLNEGIDFNKSQDRHLFGDIYEQLLRDLQNAGNAGEYYTPRAVTQFMVERTNPRLGELILDPACGTGGFLTCALEHIRQREVKSPADEQRLQDSIRGVEKKPLPHLLCTTNMLLHGIEVPVNVRHDNTLAKPYASYTSSDRVDVIMTNPPFGGQEEDGTEKNFPASYRTKETADLFLTLIIHLLRDKGRGAIVLPDGTLFGEGIKTRIKQELLEKCNLHTIVRLPNGVFAPYTGIKTNLLFLTKGEPTKEIWYYEHPYLVPQNDKDEPGAELLKRILDEKRRLTRENIIKKTPVLDSIASDAHPFVVPENWAWAYLNDYGDWGSGSTPNRTNHEFYGGTIPWLKSGELNDGIVSESEEKVTELALEKRSLRLNKPGDVLFAMYGATVGKVAILGIEATTNQAVCACTCFSGVFNRYLFVLLKAFKQQFISESAGAAQPNFSKDKIIRTIAPLPPLAEQNRIVAKVKELLALCDELEARQTAAREHRTQLVRSALDHLTTAKDESEFKKHSAFCLQHSELLFDSVPALRQSILSLAVQGHIGRRNKTAWECCKLRNLVTLITSGSRGWAEFYADEGPLFVRAQNVTRDGSLLLEDMAHVRLPGGSEGSRTRIKKDDLLVVITGAGVSQATRVKQDLGEAYVSQHVALIRLREPAFAPWLDLQLHAPAGCFGQLQEFIYGAKPGLNLENLRELELLVPPLPEQQRMVAKVDELMRWCDALEARLTGAQTTATHLLDATLRQLVKA